MNHGVCEKKVPIAECWARAGLKPIGTIWADVNKGGGDNPEYRSRLVAKEIHTHKDDDLFAATPPLEAKHMLMYAAWQKESDTRGDTRHTISL